MTSSVTAACCSTARLISQGSGIAELAQRRVARLVCTHPGGNLLGNLLFKVKAQLVIEPVSCTVPSKQHPDPHSQLVNQRIRHSAYPSWTIRLIAPESRSQLAVSFSSCARPAAVSE